MGVFGDTRGAVALFTRASAAQTGASAVNGADLPVGGLRALAIDVNVTALAGTTPSLVVSLQRKGTDGIYYPVWTGAAITAVGKQSVSLGAGQTALVLGDKVRLVTTVAGTTPSVTYSMSVQGE